MTYAPPTATLVGTPPAAAGTGPGPAMTLEQGDRFCVRRLHVAPGAALAPCAHVHRAEHWIVVSGTGRATIDGAVRLVSENDTVFVPLGAVHGLENPGRVPLVLIEVQTGPYLAEDDVLPA